jgi:hypothetical protein
VTGVECTRLQQEENLGFHTIVYYEGELGDASALAQDLGGGCLGYVLTLVSAGPGDSGDPWVSVCGTATYRNDTWEKNSLEVDTSASELTRDSISKSLDLLKVLLFTHVEHKESPVNGTNMAARTCTGCGHWQL